MKNKSPMLKPDPPGPRTIATLKETARDRTLRAFESQGMTAEILALSGAELLTATKRKVQWDAKAKKFRYSRKEPDNTTRYNTLRLMLEFHDAMPSKKVDIEDKRQTRKLANALFARIEEAGMLGQDDIEVLPAPAPGEVASLRETVRSIPRNPASLNPNEMSDDP